MFTTKSKLRHYLYFYHFTLLKLRYCWYSVLQLTLRIVSILLFFLARP